MLWNESTNVAWRLWDIALQARTAGSCDAASSLNLYYDVESTCFVKAILFP
jgi:hypothetical protein